MNEALSSWPGLVVGHPLVERSPDALRDAAVDLALDDHRVDRCPQSWTTAYFTDPDLGRVVGSVSTMTACMPEAKVARSAK